MQGDIIVKVGADISSLQKNMKAATGDLEGFGSKVSGVMKTIGAVAAAGTAIAGGALFKFGKDSVFAAADMQATNAQFEQVFGDMGENATDSLAAMGKEFGMLPERLKGPLSMTTSMFKGLGMDTEDAMKTAAGAVTIAADAAAFYDKSYEDANAALNSFIKGNYEGGEAIGLFANESQLASWAAEELGTDWKTLDEAGKQVTRLKFAEAMQASAGATGQASRESESLTNMQGNLQSSWSTLLAKMGDPILPMVTGWMKQLTDKVVAFDADKLIADITGFYEKGKETVVMIGQFLDKWSPLLAGIAAGAIAFKVITTGVAAYNVIMAAYRAIVIAGTAVQWSLNAALVANPIGAVVLLIGLLVTAGVLLYKNWDVIVAKTKQLWSAIKTRFTEIKNTITDKWNEVMAFFRAVDLKQIGMNIIGGLISGIAGKATELYNKASEIANAVKNTFKNLFDINSPSRFMRDMIGENMIEGWIGGIAGMKSDVLRTTADMGEWMTPKEPTLSYSTPSGSYGSFSSALSGSVDVSVSEQSGLLREIVMAVREGQVLTMDSRRVGGTIAPHVKAKNDIIAQFKRNGNGGAFSF